MSRTGSNPVATGNCDMVELVDTVIKIKCFPKYFFSKRIHFLIFYDIFL